MMSDVSYPYLEKLIAAAKANYPKVKAYQSKLKVAGYNVQKAKLDWFNIVSFTYLYSPNNTPTLVNPTFTSGYQVGVSTSIGNILQKPGMIKSAKESYNIAKDDQDEYNLNIEAIVKQRYFAYVQALSILNWRTKDIGNADVTVKDLKYRFEKGEQTFDNYNKAQEFYSNAVQAKITAEGGLLIAKSSLEEIIGEKLEDVK
jgi:outer membrane protein TolC